MATYKERMKLKQTYKQYKVGLVQWEDIDPEMRALLMRYYGVGQDGL